MLGVSGRTAWRTALTSLQKTTRIQHRAGALPSYSHRVELPALRASAVAHCKYPASRGSLRHQSTSAGPETTKYTFDQLRTHLAPVQTGGPDPRPAPLLLIDVREPAELQATGRIPTARNLPISSVPDGAFLPPDEFEDRFGFPKPTAGDEVVFYCKSGVRSRAAAQMVADLWGREGIKVSEFPGSWTEWEGRGGEVEK